MGLNMKKRIITVVLFVVLILTVGTSLGAESRASSKTKKLSFESEEGSLLITNYTSYDVVVFAGRVEKKLILGGVRSGEERSFNLSKLPKIPKSGELLVRIVPTSTYYEKKRITEDDVVYTRLVAYNLDDKKVESVIDIPENIDMEQRFCAYLTNPSDAFLLEVREMSPNGDVIATLPPMQSDKRIFLLPKDDYRPYILFPSFVCRDPKTKELVTIASSAKDRMALRPRPIAEVATIIRFATPSNEDIPCDVAFIKIENNSLSAFEFHNGEACLRGQEGFPVTLSGKTDVYELLVDSKEGKLYDKLSFRFDDFTKMPLNPYSFKAGYEYKITISSRIHGRFEYDIQEIGRKDLVEAARIQLFMEN